MNRGSRLHVKLQLSVARENPTYPVGLNWVIAKETNVQLLDGKNVWSYNKGGINGGAFYTPGPKDKSSQSYEDISLPPSFLFSTRVLWTLGKSYTLELHS